MRDSAEPLTRPDDRMVLSGIRWVTYEYLLADHQDRSAPRFTYDHGTLEILCPGAQHESSNRTLAHLVGIVAAEWDVDFLDLGSTTFRRADLEQGFDPDTCLYFRDAEQIRGDRPITLAEDQPPELVIEIDIEHASLNKLPIYGAFGVPEVWRYKSERLTIFTLEDGVYREAECSLALPQLRPRILTRFLNASEMMGRRDWAGSVRDWARSQSERPKSR